MLNIEKIFNALEKDEMNSALRIICYEFEQQGYSVKINGYNVKAEDIDEEKFPFLEYSKNPLGITLIKDSIIEQKFAINFVDYHNINISKI